MKQLTLLCTIITISCVLNKANAQHDYNIFIGASIDPKMAVVGPHDDGGALNPEIIGGFTINNQVTIWFGYEWLKRISYQKYTFLGTNYIINFTERFNAKIGPEFSIIYRHKDNPNDSRYNYNDDNWSYGINTELEFKMFSNYIGLYLNSNIYKAEPYDNLGNKMKNVRWDVKAGIILYLPVND